VVHYFPRVVKAAQLPEGQWLRYSGFTYIALNTGPAAAAKRAVLTPGVYTLLLSGFIASPPNYPFRGTLSSDCPNLSDFTFQLCGSAFTGPH
jgi:hypothetical protein